MNIFSYKQSRAALGSLLFLIISYSCNSPTSKVEISLPDPKEVTTDVEIPPKNFTRQQIAKFAISTIMNQPEEIISVSEENDKYIVSYGRKSDSENFKYKARIDGNKIIWGNSDGRWRDSEYDEKISFREDGTKLTIV